MHNPRLGGLLVRAGCITEAQLEIALSRCAREPQAGLIGILCEAGFATLEQIGQVFSEQLGIGCIDPAAQSLPPELARLLPLDAARAHRAVPVRAEGDTLHLAMADPLDTAATEALRTASRRKIQPLFAPEASIRLAISRLYGQDSAEQALRELRAGQAEARAPSDSLPESDAPIIRLVNSFLDFAASRNASDIHLEPREGELAVRMRIDGILHQTFTVPKSAQNALIARIKVMGNMDLAQHQLPLDGRCSYRTAEGDMDLRISTLPTIHGEKAVIRLLHRNPALLSPEGIGLAGDQLTAFSSLLEHTSGVILLAGPTGSGKSSTMYTMIEILNTPQVNLVTLEDPVEYQFHRVNQVQILEKTGMTFASGLRSVLRQDPDIIAVGEIRDGETADIAMGAAITGHLVLSTIHADNAPGAIDRLLDMGVAPYRIASGLRGIIAQRLVRRICPHCRERCQPTPEELQKLGLSPREDRIFYRGAGCPRCFQTGYLGRTAVFEILPITPGIRRCITDQNSRETLEARIQESGYTPLLHQGIRLAEAGITTPEEVFRTLRSTL